MLPLVLTFDDEPLVLTPEEPLLDLTPELVEPRCTIELDERTPEEVLPPEKLEPVLVSVRELVDVRPELRPDTNEFLLLLGRITE